MDMRFSTWNIRSTYRAGSPRAVVDYIKLDLRETGMVWTGSIWLRIKRGGGLL
jgi:hypothetical protein